MNKQRHDALSTGLMLIGIGAIFLMPGFGFWPWILVVVAVAGIPSAIARGANWWAWQSIFWMVGLALLFASGRFWPGILILSGVSMLMGLIVTRRGGSAQTGTQRTPGAPGGASETVEPWQAPDDQPLDPDVPVFDDGVPTRRVDESAGRSSETKRL